MSIRVLVVDDSAIYRKIICDIVKEIPELELVGTAPNGKQALSMAELKHPNLILLDVNMPVMDGITTLRELKKRYNNIDVIMISSADRQAASITLQALQEGALEFIPKPNTSSFVQSKQEILRALKLAINVHEYRQSGQWKTISTPKKHLQSVNTTQLKQPQINVTKDISNLKQRPLPKKVGIVAIGVSTGGPKALGVLIPTLPKDFPVPIVIVQHIPAGFSNSLAEYLNKKSKIQVLEGSEGMPLQPKTVYIAPGGKHMVIRTGKDGKSIGIVDSPPVNNCKPSVDVLFRSLVTFNDGEIITVMLTGMGYDGADGVSVLTRRKNSYNIVQDASSCVVYGMPRVVVEKGLAHEILPLNKIAPRLVELVKGRM